MPTGPGCRTAGHSRRLAGSGSTATTMSMSLTAATTQCWCSIVTATFCAPGVKANTRGRTAWHVTPDDTMFLTDDGGHFVRKVTLDGKVLLELGVPGKTGALY